jgi:hypothetical protein
MSLSKKATSLAAVVAAFILQTSVTVPAIAQDNSGTPVNSSAGNSNSNGNNGNGNGARRRRLHARYNGNGNGNGAQKQSPVGPAWHAGQDNAQSPRRLKRAMKIQQEYEKQMLQTLGNQRPTIQQSRADLKHERQTTGANGN